MVRFSLLDSVDHLFFIVLVIIVYIKSRSKYLQKIEKEMFISFQLFCQFAEQREFKYPLLLHFSKILNYY